MAGHKLSTYAARRDFERTPEPEGRISTKTPAALRFVVQKHAARRLHYDLRLELDGVFKSWAVTRGPSLDPADKRLAVEVEDHPLDYGDFEGTIPERQYGAGTVMVWDRGTWTPEQASAEEALRDGDLKFTLHGQKLKGSWVLVRMKHDRKGGSRVNWLLVKHRDGEAREGGGDAILAGATRPARRVGTWTRSRSVAAASRFLSWRKPPGLLPRAGRRQRPRLRAPVAGPTLCLRSFAARSIGPRQGRDGSTR